LLQAEQLERILTAIPHSTATILSLEANPEDAARFGEFQELGFHRLSLGLQSLRDPHLSKLGRAHSAEKGLAAVDAAMAAGFQSVNGDLIFGIPGQTDAELIGDAQILADRGVQHISAYGLTVHEGTLLAKAVAKKEFVSVAENPEREHFLALDRYLRSRGYEHYEISNYALPGHRSSHNEIYWTGGAYRGFGPSAHSFDAAKGRRFWNLKSYDSWLQKVEAGASPQEGEELLTVEERHTERLYLGLRRSEGVALGDIEGVERARPKIDAALKAGLATETTGTLRLTADGMAVADTIVESMLGSIG
jgi:oxygen-independent coproporphyrinogen-3 oxidase